MDARDSAYEALGLKPGASRAQVDEAYRRLIKQHHPDRAGGDPDRAADVNRAYTLLRQQQLAVGPQSRPVPVVIQPKGRLRSRSTDWLFTIIVLAIVIGGVAAMQMGSRGNMLAHPIKIRWPSTEAQFRSAGASPLVSFDEPLHLPVVDNAIAQARKFHSAKDLAGAEIYSRDCQANLRREMSLVWFDTCAAFDEATITLTADEELAHSQLFNQSAIVAREMAAAHALSDDIFEADSRLHQIRSRVDMQLLPMVDPAAGQRP
jgi:hypothetical protein